MLQVTVALPSGQGETFSLEPSSKVGDFEDSGAESIPTWLLEACGCRP